MGRARAWGRDGMTLLDFVRALDADRVRALSRMVIEPAPGRARVVATFAAFTTADPLALDERGEVIGPVLRGPVSLANAAGMRALRPPVAMLRTDRVPDAEGSIEVDDLPGQLAALRASATVGGLHVEKLAKRKLVITTHAATQSERDGWLRSLRGAA